MDVEFRRVLSGVGLGNATLSVLSDEHVSNMDIFLHLREEHFERLLPKLTVGEHATLLQLWERKATTSVEVFFSCCNSCGASAPSVGV